LGVKQDAISRIERRSDMVHSWIINGMRRPAKTVCTGSIPTPLRTSRPGFAVSTCDNGTLTASDGTTVFAKFIAGTALRAPIRVQ
jgi:hypothetical protein